MSDCPHLDDRDRFVLAENPWGDDDLDCGTEEVGEWSRVNCDAGRIVWRAEDIDVGVNRVPDSGRVELHVIQEDGGYRLAYLYESGGASGYSKVNVGEEPNRHRGIARAETLLRETGK